MNVTTHEAKLTSRWLTFRRAIAAAFTASLAVAGLLPLLGASAAGAATSVSSVSGPSATPATVGATSVYTIGFTTSASGALAAGSGTITLVAPSGTVFASTASDYTVNNGSGAIAASTVSTGSSGASVTITTPVAIADNTTVTVVIAGITNPSAGSSYVISVSTSADTAAVNTPTYAITSGISNVTLSLSSTETDAPGVTYTVGFTTSATGSLVGGSGTITVNFPAATTSIPGSVAFPADASDYFVVVGGVTAAAQAVTSNGTDQAVITVPSVFSIGNSASVTVIIMGVQNPDVAEATTYSAANSDALSVSTSSDTSSANAPAYTIGTTPTQIADVWTTDFTSTTSTQEAYYSNDAAGATGVTYDVAFEASSSGALAANTGTITVSAPAGFTLPSAASDYVVQDWPDDFASSGTVDPASAVTVSGTQSSGMSVTLTTPVAISDSDGVIVAIAGVTNTSTSGTSYIFKVSTSADTASIADDSDDFSIYTAPSAVSVSASANSPSSTALVDTPVVLKSNYKVTFTATTALPDGDTVLVCFPTVAPGQTADTTGWQSGAVGASATIATGSGVAGATIMTFAENDADCQDVLGANYVGDLLTLPADFNAGSGLSADQQATIDIHNIVNPDTPDTDFQVYLSTETDEAFATSSDFTINTQPTNQVYSATLTTDTGTLTFIPPVTSASESFTLDYPEGTTGLAGDLSGSGCAEGAPTGTNPIVVDLSGCDITANATVTITSTAVLPDGNDDVTIAMGSGPSAATNYFFVAGLALPNAASLTSITPSNSAVSGTADYSIVAETSVTGQLNKVQPSDITIDIGAETITAITGDTCVVNGIATSCTLASPNVTVVVPSNIGNYTTLDVTIIDATNAAASGTGSATLASTTDKASNSATFTIGTQVTSVTPPTVSPDGVGATGALYAFNFVPATGLTGGTSTITAVFPTGTVLPSTGITVNGLSASATVSGSTVVITVPAGAGSIAAASTVSVAIDGVTNPTTPSTTYTMDLFTSSDTAALASDDYTIATAVSNVAGPVADPASANNDSMYTIEFETSANGEISEADDGYVCVLASKGTSFDVPAVATIDGIPSTATDVGDAECDGGNTANETDAEAEFPLSAGSIGDSTEVVMSIDDVVNPGTAGTGLTWEVWTEGNATEPGDEGSVSGPAYSIGTAVGATTVTLSNDLAGNGSTYTIATTATTALVGGTDTVSIDFPGTTGVSSTASSYLVNGVTASTVSVSGTTVTITLPANENVGAGGQLTITAFITNPTSTGTFSLSVYTSKDTTPVVSNTYTIYQPAPPTVSSISPATGPTAGGTSVTITGTNFTSSATVSFGAVAATGVVVNSSGTSITAVSPAQAQATVNVTVTTVGGKDGQTNNFAYVAPLPTVTAISPATGLTSGGTTVTVTGTGLTAATAVTFGTVAATSVTVVSDTSLTAVSPAGTGTVNVTVTTAGGTSATSSADQFTYAAAAPTVTAISPTGGPAAGGTTVTVTGTNFFCGGTASCVTAVDFGTVAGTSVTVSSATSLTVVSPAGTGMVNVTVTTSTGTSATSSADEFTYTAPVTQGFYLADGPGHVAAYGSFTSHGDASGLSLAAPIVGIAVTHDLGGYWLLGADGGIFTFGDAGFHGSMGGVHLVSPVVAMVGTADSQGYYEVAGDGGVFTFGDATFHGSMGGVHLNAPVVGIVVTPDGGGYWEVASDGGIFTFGDAGFYGSMGGKVLAQPVVGMIPSVDGKGYLMIAKDGGVFTFGDAGFYGTPVGHLTTANSVVGIALTPDGAGYWIAGSDGTVYAEGDASSTLTGPSIPTPITAIAS